MVSAAARVTPAMQDYVKAIYQLGAEEPDAGVVTSQRLAARLGVSAPSVTTMLKRLSDLELVRYEPYRGAELTIEGERIALEVVRHHRLLESYLVAALGYRWDEVHAEAERLEHHISEAMEARMAAALGHPEVDPHGDPIPQHDGTMAAVTDQRLSDLAPGDDAIVARVPDRDPARLRYLEQLGLRPGARVSLLDALPFDGPLRIRVGERKHAIGRALAAVVQVASAGDAPRRD
jgi:DtxR family Mn-dependent transcriptional regulator